MRRSSQFKQALELIKQTKVNNLGENVLHFLEYQKRLIENNDTSAHQISDTFDKPWIKNILQTIYRAFKKLAAQ
ncbi:MAG: hypothetical protein J7545_00595 [Roseofilum sp. SBFL]|uniref:hypothetical protein n=1 Tax=unclassified Roseofilum TaxID=2620099 RepID=UPI001B2764AE|nr:MULTISPECIES: hypothetical protein [unclassified Roseofilum]MBP0012982.1 hypothetical protein [Roseofilum sp. SID3]MBP0024946.1 hypothetical protein [Roseofilum sp. SID2]MBP0039055.1 hypothetical protein [Roseofilum sp. SID1]MBP0040464.1 hypothetical protein [Roseofilum sp. SBFL]